MVDITIADLTNTDDPNENTGTAIFDVLMNVVESHIENQFQKGRITGADYATVYLGSLQAVLSQSVQFVLQEQAAGKQGDLIDAQITEAAATTVRNDSLAAAEVSLKEAQELDVEYVTLNHRPEQTIQLQEQVDLLQSQDLVEIEKIATQVQQTAKVTNEVSLLAQKELTELAQTSDTDVVKYGAGGTALTGVLGAQKTLYSHQSAGFKAKHHVDTVKQLADIWSVGYAITDGVSPNLPVALTALSGADATDLDAEIGQMKAAFDTLP